MRLNLGRRRRAIRCSFLLARPGGVALLVANRAREGFASFDFCAANEGGEFLVGALLQVDEFAEPSSL
jgi:hypothetical protein